MERGRTVSEQERPLSRAEIRELTALMIKKFRSEHGRTIAEGEQLVREALASSWTVHEVIVTPEFLAGTGIEPILTAMQNRRCVLRTVPPDALNKLSELATSPGILAIVSPPTMPLVPFTKGLALALDRVSDPVNLGSIARTACFYGVERLYLSDECADRMHPRGLRASMGGLFHLPTETAVPFVETLHKLQKQAVTIVIADAIEGEAKLPISRDEGWVLVLGSEAHGIREEVRKLADLRWRLEPIGRDLTLNVAAAAAVLLDRLTCTRSIPQKR